MEWLCESLVYRFWRVQHYLDQVVELYCILLLHLDTPLTTPLTTELVIVNQKLIKTLFSLNIAKSCRSTEQIIRETRNTNGQREHIVIQQQEELVPL